METWLILGFFLYAVAALSDQRKSDSSSHIRCRMTATRDAEANAEAVQRPSMRFVPIKSEAQLDLQTIHRARQRLVSWRTALIN